MRNRTILTLLVVTLAALCSARPRAKVTGKLPSEAEVRVAGCEGGWMRVKYKGVSGWLHPEDQCPSPVTTCN